MVEELVYLIGPGVTQVRSLVREQTRNCRMDILTESLKAASVVIHTSWVSNAACKNLQLIFVESYTLQQTCKAAKRRLCNFVLYSGLQRDRSGKSSKYLPASVPAAYESLSEARLRIHQKGSVSGATGKFKERFKQSCKISGSSRPVHAYKNDAVVQERTEASFSCDVIKSNCFIAES